MVFSACKILFLFVDEVAILRVVLIRFWYCGVGSFGSLLLSFR